MTPSRPHRRWNPLQKNWVLVSPHRATRPWSGSREVVETQKRPRFDPHCYLCPGNVRANGTSNPTYESVFVFDNDFAAVLSQGGDEESPVCDANGLIRSKEESGICKVICFSPRHDATLADLHTTEIKSVIDEWGRQYKTLGDVSFVSHVMTFENKGEIMGCSNPHPHGQIWATESIPNVPLNSAVSQREFLREYGRPLLHTYLEWELSQEERIVASNDSWVAVIPYWAVWPFEVMIIPRMEVSSITDLGEIEREKWADIIHKIVVAYDNLFEVSFPYSMGVYQRPTDGEKWDGFIMHQVFLPPLLRSSTVKKFMVGFELCAEPQRDITPEEAARKLKDLVSA